MSVFGLHSGQRALVVAAHPDDETLGCGGTIARLAAEGIEVYVLAVTVRTASMCGDVSDPRVRVGEFSSACTELGVTSGVVGWIDETGELDIAAWPRAVVDLIERHEHVSLATVRPDVLLIPAASGFHQDHHVVHQAAVAAARVHDHKHTPRVVVGFRGVEDRWSVREEPWRVHVDISEHWPVKERALRCYASGLRSNGHPRNVEHIRTVDAAEGGAMGWRHGESFVPYRLAY